MLSTESFVGLALQRGAVMHDVDGMVVMSTSALAGVVLDQAVVSG